MVDLKLLHNLYKDKKVLITGSTGFKGSWLSLLLHKLDAKVYGFALEPKRENDNYVKCNLDKIITQKIGDVRNFRAFRDYVEEINPDFAFHLAAQPLVLDGYNNPRETFETNTMGTVNFFEILRNLPNIQFGINITSDKCYRNQEWIWGYRENEPMGGEDPYSASKGCSELISHAYAKSFFTEKKCVVATARAGNVIGGGDWSENRIIPDIFRAINKNEKIILRNPNAIRPWQFVLEPLLGYLILGYTILTKKELSGEGWNFGPNPSSEKSVKQLVDEILINLGKITHEVDTKISNFHESHYLKLDISKSKTILKWEPILDFNQTMIFTIKGYLDEKDNNDILQSRMKQIDEFINLAGVL